MKTVNVRQARAQLSRLMKRAHAGEEITIAKGRVPYARLVSLAGRQPKREPGTLKGSVELHAAFFKPLPSGWNDGH
jgi:prevent-host-death family protein